MVIHPPGLLCNRASFAVTWRRFGNAHMKKANELIAVAKTKAFLRSIKICTATGAEIASYPIRGGSKVHILNRTKDRSRFFDLGYGTAGITLHDDSDDVGRL